MDIKYLGHASFSIKSKNARIVTDPYDSKRVGLKFPKLEADIVTLSHEHPDHNESSQIGGSPLIINWPGEFEKLGVRIFGHQSFHDKQQGTERGENTLYKFELDGMSVLHCGDLGHILNDNTIDEIGNVDILMVPTGGFYTIDPNEAVSLVKKIEPSIVIPMHFNRPELNQEVFSNLQGVDVFLKLMGAENAEPVEKLSIKAEEIDPENTKIVLMSISS